MNELYVTYMDHEKMEEWIIKEEISFTFLHFVPCGGWKLTLEKDACFFDGDKEKILTEGIYEITFKEFKTCYLYVSFKKKEENFRLYQRIDLLFSENGIILKNPLLNPYHIQIEKSRLITDCPFVYVNGSQKKEAQLFPADEIQLLNLRIFLHKDFIYCNDSECENHLLPLKIQHSFKAGIEKKKEIIPYHYAYEDVFFEMEAIRPFSFEYRDKKGPARNLIPQSVMCLGMLIMGILNAKESWMNNASTSRILMVIIMPCTMIFSLFFWPVITIIKEKRNEKKALESAVKKYLHYLDELIQKTKDNKERYLSYIHSSFEKPSFYIDKRSFYYSVICLGTKKIKQDPSPLTDYPTINERIKKLNELKDTGLPYLFKITDYRTVHLQVRENEKLAWFYKIVFELANRHSCNDLKIAVYCQKKEQLLPVFSLPHLFHSGFRMTFIKESEVMRLERLCLPVETILIALNPIGNIPDIPKLHILYLFDEDVFVSLDLKMNLKGKTAFDPIHNESFMLPKILYEYPAITQREFAESNKKRSISFHDFFCLNKEEIIKNYENPSFLEASFGTDDKGQLLSLDLHEHKDGPHGLIGGTTGSGKSEFLLTLLLNLAMRYSPDHLQMIIIDYKGGGIKESLSMNGEPIPHIIASLSNMNSSGFERLIIKLSFLLKQREERFLYLSRKYNRPILNIDDAAKLERMPHLLVVIDEFAELKKNHPEKMKELISFSRIGRSLGIHLLLCTQHPALSIDEEIKANCAFKVCLKVTSRLDSRSIIGNEEAFDLKAPGEFILVSPLGKRKGRAFYCHDDADPTKRKRVSLLDENLQPLRTIEQRKDSPTILESGVKAIFEALEDFPYTKETLDYKPHVSMEKSTLVTSYNYKGKDLVLGETDDYLHDKKELLVHSLNESALFCSPDFSLCGNILQAIEDEDFFVISEKRQDIAHSISMDNEEEIRHLFKRLSETEKKTFLIIENLPLFCERYKSLEEDLRIFLKRKEGVVIYAFVKENEHSLRILSCFMKRYILNTEDQKTISGFFGTRPLMKGNSFFYKDSLIPFVPVLPVDNKKNSCEQERSFYVRD